MARSGQPRPYGHSSDRSGSAEALSAPAMKRYRAVAAMVFLALFPYQATGTSLAYSLSYQDTAASRRAHPPDYYDPRSVPNNLLRLRNYFKTDIYLVSMADAKTSRVFSDEGPYFEIIPPGMFGGPGAMVVAENKAYAVGIERGGDSVARIYSGRPAVYELALDASNKYRKLFEIQSAHYAAAPLFISPSGTKIGYLSVLNEHNVVFIHDVATGALLKSWDVTNLFRRCFDCSIASVGWLADGNRLFFSLDFGEQSGPQSELGTYVVSEDGGVLDRLPLEQGRLQMQGYRDITGSPPALLGQAPDGSYIFEDMGQKKTELLHPERFLVITTPERKVLGQISLHSSTGLYLGMATRDLSRSGKFVAFSDPLLKNYQREEHVWGMNLETREEKELITLPARTISSSEPKVTLNILGWLEER